MKLTTHQIVYYKTPKFANKNVRRDFTDQAVRKCHHSFPVGALCKRATTSARFQTAPTGFRLRKSYDASSTICANHIYVNTYQNECQIIFPPLGVALLCASDARFRRQLFTQKSDARMHLPMRILTETEHLRQKPTIQGVTRSITVHLVEG